MSALQPTDALALGLSYLAEKMPASSVSSRVSTRSNMVKLEAVGGTRTNHVIDRQLLTVQTWDSDSENAFELCATAVRHFLDLPSDEVHGSHVRDVTIFGLPVNFPDPDTSTPRYQATVELNIRPKEAS